MEDKRKFKRINKEFDLRVYTSLTSGAYSVKVKDIGRGGAFIQSKHLPEIGETITFEFLDNFLKSIYMDNAKVLRTEVVSSEEERGFAVIFYKPLKDDFLEKIVSY